VKTNEKIITLAQAVVRHVIANNELNTVIKNREILTSEITSKLKPLLKGWGMWLERVDIKDVRICSMSLFQDLQCKFKEEQRKEATIKRETTEKNLKEERMVYEMTDKKRYVK
jgi:regulator of protease activity HflC (stomatin/prohibitin superfamily)